MTKVLATDLYQLTMLQSYFNEGTYDKTAAFDYFVRSLPEKRSYLIALGLETLVDYLQNLKFEKEDLDYLRSTKMFTENFLNYLKNFKFEGELYAIPEGTPVFGEEPIVRLTGNLGELQFIETYLLTTLNHQTMIASKASRVVDSAKGKAIVDFGLRRAHGSDAGLYGSRASYIAGCVGTSNVEAGQKFGIPIKGTHAHSYVMSFKTELDAFRAYVKSFPDNATLLIDTYNVMGGAKNASIVAKEIELKGRKLGAVRLDSGDLVNDSKAVRKFLDFKGLEYVKIFASNDLNECKIKKLLNDGACIDAFGVGTEMEVSKDHPSLGGVYKLVELDGIQKMKLSEGKRSLPGIKQVYRKFEDGKFVKDVIGFNNEKIEGLPLLQKVMEKGSVIIDLPTIEEIREYCLQQRTMLPEKVKLLENPEKYEVELSSKLTKLMENLIEKYKSDLK